MHMQRDAARIAFDDVGLGLPVVFLHGFPHDRSLWAHQRVALSSRLRCIVPDLRGFGESTGVAHDIDTFADDIAALLDHLELEDAVVCGLSMGGYIALAMWRRHPGRVRGLVLCDTKAGADTPETRTARNELIAKAKAEGAEAVADEVVDAMRAMMARQSTGAIAGALQALRDRPDSRETLGTITVPTLVLVGEDDVLTPPAEAQAMMALLPPAASARLETIAGAGHASCVERPAAVTHALADFLAALAAQH